MLLTKKPKQNKTKQKKKQKKKPSYTEKTESAGMFSVDLFYSSL